MEVFWNGQYDSIDRICIHPNDRGFLFGDGVYEVVRIYGGRCFEMAAHERRLLESAASIGIELEGFEGMEPVMKKLLSRQSLPDGNGVLYYQVTRGTAPRKHFFPEPTVQPNHYAYVQVLPVPDLELRPGAKAVSLPDRRWLECHIKSISLLGSVLAAEKAKQNQASEAVLHRDGIVTEGSHTNVFAVMDNILWTHPANHLVLNGITRRVVLELARRAGMEFKEVPIELAQLKNASEIFLTGTTVEIWPVVELDGLTVGDGKTGPITRELQSAFDQNVDLLA